MIIKKNSDFEDSLEKIVLFIAKDSKVKAIKFQKKLNKILNNLSNMPYKFRQSFYYDDKNIRDLIYKGYTIPYLIDKDENCIVILDIFKWIDR
jgi:plasmid stabilization system protein ParE